MKYISKYSNGKNVTPAQYITELLCENKAKKEKKDLYFRFWTNKEWAAFYRNQIATANKLIKTYDPQCIIRALKNPLAAKIYSLRAPHLIPIIESECLIMRQENKELTKTYDRSENKKFATDEKNKKSIISRLEELE
jgi:hypothetical protein